MDYFLKKTAKKNTEKAQKILVKNPATQNFQKYISLRSQKLVKMCSKVLFYPKKASETEIFEHRGISGSTENSETKNVFLGWWLSMENIGDMLQIVSKIDTRGRG